MINLHGDPIRKKTYAASVINLDTKRSCIFSDTYGYIPSMKAFSLEYKHLIYK